MKFKFQRLLLNPRVKFAATGQILPVRPRFAPAAANENIVFIGVFNKPEIFSNVAQALLNGGLS